LRHVTRVCVCKATLGPNALGNSIVTLLWTNTRRHNDFFVLVVTTAVKLFDLLTYGLALYVFATEPFNAFFVSSVLISTLQFSILIFEVSYLTLIFILQIFEFCLIRFLCFCFH